MILKLFWECNSICTTDLVKERAIIACLMQHSFCVISKNFYPNFSIFKSPIIHCLTLTPPPAINYCFQKLLGHVGGLHIPKSINLKTITYANSGRQTGSIMTDLKMVNRPFYRYGGHIELIWFKEYYRMPRGDEHISFVFSSAFRDIFS